MDGRRGNADEDTPDQDVLATDSVAAFPGPLA
jgi:hypothetical protein